MAELRGLSEQEAAARRARGLGNKVPLRTSRTYGEILRENVFTFLNNVLFILGAALALLGRVSDALVSVGVVLVNVLVSVVQEVRAKRTLDRIALLTRPRATVIRDGRERELDPGEIVVGDLLVVHPGDQIVVDGRVVGEGAMDVDESLLTGESDLVPKREGDPVYSGSFCVSGSACYQAEKVGAQSLASQLTAGARAFRRVSTPLQREINLVIRVILLVAIYVELLLAIDAVLDAAGLVASVQIAVVVAGLVPQGLILATAVAYAAGAVRIAGRGALVQQANAIESLSHVDVLCLDKTGTLTANRLRLHAVAPLQGDEATLRRALGLVAASTAAPNRTTEAIAAACPGQARRPRAEVPFSSARKWSALAFAEGEVRGVYVLGAPEVLQPLLGPGADLGPRLEEWTASGLRVLLLAHHPDPEALRVDAGVPMPSPGLVPLGLVSFADELRPEARETLARFAEAGVRLKVISGDNPRTVAALARQAGLAGDLQLVSGQDLASMAPPQFAAAAEAATIFGRITPQQKEQLVRALRGQGHHVAMIGDGVNDVLSLKQADLAIAMASGSQATRAVADIVLLDDSFAVLPAAVREGQRILAGMQDILKLFLTRVLYETLLILSIAVVGGFPYTPKQAALLTLLTVGIPTLALAAWARPSPPRRGGLVRSLLHFVLPASLTLALVGLGIYLAYLVPTMQALQAAAPGIGAREAMAQALPVAQSALTTVTVLGGLLLIPLVEPPSPAWVGGDRLSGDPRPAWLAALLALAYLAMAAFPPLRQFADLAPLRSLDYLLLAGVVVLWGLALRFTWRARLLDRVLGTDLSPE